MDIPDDIRDLITRIVNTDEGGWDIWHTEGDNDGGWTIAGLTAYAYMNYVYPHRTRTMQEMRSVFNGPLRAKVLENIYEIYYSQYIVPSELVTGDETPFPFELSCIINCGKGGLTEVFESIPKHITNEALVGNGASDGYKEAFLEAWKNHYREIVRDNPSKAQFLHGWLNRVAHYE